jgi:hypothetical protein
MLKHMSAEERKSFVKWFVKLGLVSLVFSVAINAFTSPASDPVRPQYYVPQQYRWVRKLTKTLMFRVAQFPSPFSV